MQDAPKKHVSASCRLKLPKITIELYGGDKDHFENDLEKMFNPAIKKSGLAPIKPIADGADVIHDRIIWVGPVQLNVL